MSLISRQTTLSRAVRFSGKGLHSGRIVHLDILPAGADTGIVFHRTDSSLATPVKAHAFNISATTLSTTIGEGPSAVSTIEHLMAAFAGLGITNAICKLNSPEVPILDGSSLPFVRKFLEAGQKALSTPQNYFKIIKPFEVRNGDQFIRVEPSVTPQILCSIDFPYAVVGSQSVDYQPSVEDFIKIANARTFCHIRDVDSMREKGLALGGSLENAIIISDDGLLNENGLHSETEFAEHKLLDLIGDLALVGAPIIGKISAYKSGHQLNAAFTTALIRAGSAVFHELSFENSQHTALNLVNCAAPHPVWASLG